MTTQDVEVAVVGAGIVGLAVAHYLSAAGRTRIAIVDSGQPMALKQAALLTLAKIPNLLGMLTYYRRRRTGDDMRIIEYK